MRINAYPPACIDWPEVWNEYLLASKAMEDRRSGVDGCHVYYSPEDGTGFELNPTELSGDIEVRAEINRKKLSRGCHQYFWALLVGGM